jgi:hypothetical protein
MIRAPLIAGLAALVLVAPASADPPVAKPDNDQAVTLSPVALPIVVNGHLANYVFVTVKVWLTPNADVFALRDKEPYFRDALVRAGHRTPFVLPNDLDHLDERKLDSSLFADATAIAGPGTILRVQVLSQTPQHQLRNPH